MNKKYHPVDLTWWLVVFVCGLLLFAFGKAYAGGKCNGNHNCSDTIVDAGSSVENNIAGDSGNAIGIGGADYDIGRGSCRYHVGGFTVAIARRDKFCEGIDLIRLGMVDAGILHICKQTGIGENYDSLEDCQDGLEPVLTEPVETPELAELYSKAAQFDEYYDEEEERREKIEYLEVTVMQQQERIEQLATRPRVTREVVKPQPLISQELAEQLRVKK